MDFSVSSPWAVRGVYSVKESGGKVREAAPTYTVSFRRGTAGDPVVVVSGGNNVGAGRPSHMAVLTPREYLGLRSDAATAGVIFPAAPESHSVPEEPPPAEGVLRGPATYDNLLPGADVFNPHKPRNYLRRTLTKKQVERIHKLKGKVSQTELAKQYDVSQAEISRVESGKRWKIKKSK